MGLQCSLARVQHNVLDEAILRGPRKQLKTPFVWFVFYILPLDAGCRPFVGNHHLVHRLLWGLCLTPEGSIEEAEQYLDFEEAGSDAKDLVVVVEVDHHFQQPEPL